MIECVWPVKEGDRKCGYCIKKQWCSLREYPKEDIKNVGSRYIDVMRREVGIDPLEDTRRKEVVWVRNMVAFRLILDGYRMDDVAMVIHRNRCTVFNCVRGMEWALTHPNQFYAEMDIWKKFQSCISLNKKQPMDLYGNIKMIRQI